MEYCQNVKIINIFFEQSVLYIGKYGRIILFLLL